MSLLRENNILDILPLTSLQTSLLFSYLGEQEGNKYKEITRYQINANVSLNQVREAIYSVITDNEMLRTVFRWENLSQPVQVILKEKEVPVALYDVSEEKERSIEAVVSKLEEESYAKPMDIRTNPIKFDVFRMGPNKYYLSIINHHILFDGWSNSILLKELYDRLAVALGKKKADKRKKASFKKYLTYRREQEKKGQIDFWGGYLKGITKKTTLPGMKNRIVKESKEILLQHTEDKQKLARIKKLTSEIGVSLAAALYAIWGIVYFSRNGEKNILVGTAFDGRPTEIENINNTIGLFMNTVPFRMDVNPEEKLVNYIKKVNESLQNVREFQYIPYLDIAAQSEIKPMGDLYDSIIIIQNYPVDSEVLEGSDEISFRLHSRKITTGVKLTIEVRVLEGFFIDVSYQEGYYDKKTVNGLVSQYVKSLEQLCDGKNNTVADILYFHKQDSNGISQLMEGGDF